MTRLAVSVEGQTEEEFVKQVLADHLRARDVESTPIVLGRARGRSGGGRVSSDRLASEMACLYHSFDVVTSLVDFYGFRDKGDRTVQELETYLAGRVAKTVGRTWDERRVVPYVQRHEFEGLLFSDVEVFATELNFPQDSVADLRGVREQFDTPEDINDQAQTAPSKRIAGIIPTYSKVLHGPVLAREIGLDTIRAECPGFDAWITRLESLGDDVDVAPDPTGGSRRYGPDGA